MADFNSAITPMAQGTYCLTCVGEYMQALNKRQEDGETPLPKVWPADTWAPSWQTTTIMGQFMISCVALPSCMRHLNVSTQSPMEQATRSGLLLGGQSPQ